MVRERDFIRRALTAHQTQQLLNDKKERERERNIKQDNRKKGNRQREKRKMGARDELEES